MKRYWGYIRPYLFFFLAGPLLMLTEVFGEITIPKMMSLIINNGVPNHDIAYILRVGASMVGFAMLMALGGVGGNYCAARASVCFSADLRRDLFHKVQKFSFQNIDHFSTGSLVTRLTNDVQQVQILVRLAMLSLFRSPGMLVGALFMAFSINSRLAVVILVVVPILACGIAFLMTKAFPRFTIMQQAIDRLNTNVQENLTNVRVIKSFVREEYEEARFKEKSESLKDMSLRAMNVVICTMPMMTLAMNVTMIAVVWYGGGLIIAGNMKVGDLTAFTTYIVQILMSLMMLAMVFLQISRALASLRRISEVLDERIDLTDEFAKEPDRKVMRGEITFEHVSFGYGASKAEEVLHDINFSAKPGQVIGIIGSTGSGKTSLVQLIPRLYDVTAGRVLVDGVDVREYSLEHLRNGVAMVLQKNVLFTGSIAENLRWGDEAATDEQLSRAAQSAQADSFVRAFADGYDNVLGQGGAGVSGGQKQRLCIARALLKKPKILILDDSTSAVDTATEARIREAFRTDLKDTTKIIIAQRIGSVEEADRILVLDEGRIVGDGTHEELLESCEAYQEICYSQREKKEVGA